jgi:hypothetical protein
MKCPNCEAWMQQEYVSTEGVPETISVYVCTNSQCGYTLQGLEYEPDVEPRWLRSKRTA